MKRRYQTLLLVVPLLFAMTLEAKEKKLPTCDDDTPVVTRGADGSIPAAEYAAKGCRIEVKALHPTQSSVGMDAVSCKATKITAKYKDGKLDKYLGETARWVPMVRGPGGLFYITDHHHLSTALWNADVPGKKKVVNAYLLDDWSGMARDDFWKNMQQHHDTWLENNQGEKIPPAELPKHIDKMDDDPMRTLSAWVRESCGYVKCDASSDDQDDSNSCEARFKGKVTCAPSDTYFLEFKWADYFRNLPEVKKAMGSDPYCSEQPLDDKCLSDQYSRLKEALPAAMKAATDKAAVEKAVGDKVGFNPEEQKGEPQPKNCGK